MQQADIKKIASKLRIQRDKPGLSTVVFIGAGVSKSAGIPLANEIMQDLETRDDYKDFVAGCDPRTYAGYMNSLSPGDRKRLFQEYISKSKLNASYLYLATMVKEGYIDMILTVNFDPLIIKALALVNVFPSVYDIAVSNDFITGSIVYPAVIFLHGQSHGFWQLNDENELQLPTERINKLFTEISGTSTWIVSGYSGTDPVFNALCNISRFNERMYWVCYKDQDPPQHVIDKLLNVKNKSAEYVKGYDSDSFFRELKNTLRLEDPLIMSKPFTHLKESVSNIGEFVIQDRELRWADEKLVWIESAIEGFERGKGFDKQKETSKESISIAELRIRLKEIFTNQKFEEVAAIEHAAITSKDEEALKTLAYIYNDWGAAIFNSKEAKTNPSSVEDSILKFRKAAEVNNGYDVAYSNIGLALMRLSGLRNNKEELLKESYNNYSAALELNPMFFDAMLGSGNALARLAKVRQDDKLYTEAFAQFKNAAAWYPDQDKVYFNWALSLAEFGEQKNDTGLLREAIDKYEKAAGLNPTNDTFFHNWGHCLLKLAELEKNDEALLQESIEKFQKAAELNAIQEETYFNWGNALLQLARIKADEQLFNEAFGKYKKVTDINPRQADAYYNWGSALTELAELKNNSEAIYREAFEKFENAAKIDPQKSATFNNWGHALARLSRAKNNDEALLLEAFEKYARALEVNPEEKMSLLNWGDDLRTLGVVKKSEPLLREAMQKSQRVLELEPGNELAADSFGLTLFELGMIREEPQLLLEGAETLYKASAGLRKDILIDLNWALSELARRTKVADHRELFQNAKKRFLEYPGAEDGDIAYAIACTCSLLGEKKEAFSWLRIALKKSDVTREHIEKDADLENIKADTEFSRLLNQYRPEK